MRAEDLGTYYESILDQEVRKELSIDEMFGRQRFFSSFEDRSDRLHGQSQNIDSADAQRPNQRDEDTAHNNCFIHMISGKSKWLTRDLQNIPAGQPLLPTSCRFRHGLRFQNVPIPSP